MVLLDFAEDFFDGIEFLIALGSIIGLLGLIIGFIGLVWGGQYLRTRMIGVIVFSFILLGICGINTGLNFFHIHR